MPAAAVALRHPVWLNVGYDDGIAARLVAGLVVELVAGPAIGWTILKEGIAILKSPIG